MEIQYDPALYIGGIVDPERMKNLILRSQYYADIAEAKAILNSLLRTYKEIESITMELQMSDMGIDIEKDVQLEEIRQEILKARKNYFDTAVANCRNIAAIDPTGITRSIESPVDWNASEINKNLPISADTMDCDAQYFTFDSTKQTSENHINNITTHVEATFDPVFGGEFAVDAAKSVRKSLAAVHEKHSVQNTLVITCTCTHKNAAMLAPCIFDVRKLVSAWNDHFGKEGKGDSIPGMDPDEMINEYYNPKSDDPNKLYIVTGASYGSGIVGLVTFLNDKETVSKEELESMAQSLATSFRVRSFFCNASGNFSSSKEESSDVKSLVSAQTIQCHFNMYCAGLIPPINSSKVKFGVKAFTDFDPAAMEKKLVTVQNMTTGSAKTIDEGADDARTINIFQSLENNKVECVLSSLNQMEDGEHSVLDVNTLMTAFENYAKLAAEGKIGVPVNYYIKPMKRADVIDEWIKKFYPSLTFGDVKAQAEDDAKEPGGDKQTGYVK